MPVISSHFVRHTSYLHVNVNNPGIHLPELFRSAVKVVQSGEIPESCKKQHELIPVRHISRNGVSGLSFRPADYPVTIPDRDITVKIEKYLCQSTVIETENDNENKSSIVRFFSNLVSIRLTSSPGTHRYNINTSHQETVVADDRHAPTGDRPAFSTSYYMTAVHVNVDTGTADSLSTVLKQFNETAATCAVDKKYTEQSQDTDAMSASVLSCEFVQVEQPGVFDYIQTTLEVAQAKNDTHSVFNSDKKSPFFMKIWDSFKAIFFPDKKSGSITGTVTESIISTVTQADREITIKSARDYRLTLQSHVTTAAYVEEFCQHSERKTSFPVLVGQEFMPNTDSNLKSYTLPFYHHSLSPYIVKDLSSSQKTQLVQRKEAVKDDLDYDGALITKDGAIRIGTLHQLDWQNLPGITPKTGILNDNTMIYINGQNTPVYSQVTAMQAIADAYGVKVLGIHTATHGHQLKDGIQSLEDKLNMRTGPAKALEKIILNYLLENNDQEKPLRLMAHSRGGIVTSHALTNVYEKLTEMFQHLPDVSKKKARQIAKELMAGIKVTTIAGGAYHYPEGPDYEHWINKKDPVPMLFGGGEHGKAEKEVHFFSATIRKHNVDTYLKQIRAQGLNRLSDDGHESTWL